MGEPAGGSQYSCPVRSEEERFFITQGLQLELFLLVPAWLRYLSETHALFKRTTNT